MASAKQVAAQRRAEARGFRTVYQMRQFEKQNKAIGGAGRQTITRDLAQAKDRVVQTRIQTKETLFAKFGVTQAEYNKRDRENREWFDKELRRRSKAGMEPLLQAFLKTQAYHTYRTDIADRPTWTEAKVGYVLSFWAANVSRRTGYGTLFTDPLNSRRSKGFGQKDRQQAGAFNKMNAAQYFYLTQYTDLMTVNEYEVSYGSQQTRRQAAAAPARAVA